MKYTENYVYMYGQMISTCSFLLDGDFPKADGTAEIKEKYHLVGGETGTAAAVLCSLNVPVKLGGTHLGSGNEKLIKDYLMKFMMGHCLLQKSFFSLMNQCMDYPGA